MFGGLFRILLNKTFAFKYYLNQKAMRTAKRLFNYNLWLAFVLVSGLLFSCQSGKGEQPVTENAPKEKIGLLLVNHGSRSETWRKALMDLEGRVRDSILSIGKIEGIKTAHMEYTEPSIATRMKEFDKEGYSDVILVPIFLTVSPHPFDDIPTILGLKEDALSMEMLKVEKIERYSPKAKVHITPLLDFTDVLEKNVLDRTEKLSEHPKEEGIVLVGYGDVDYDKEWIALFDKVGDYVKQESGIDAYSYAWCGHIVHYSSDETTKAINKILEKKETAIVIPVLVAHDEEFQIKIIGGGIEKVKNNKERVRYKPDAILPDPHIENWIISISDEFANKIKAQNNS